VTGPHREAAVAPLEASDRAWLSGGRLWDRRVVRLRENPSLLAGIAILGLFGAVAVGALWKWGSTIADVPYSLVLANMDPPMGPSPAHPFGILSNWGVDLLDVIVRATPFDLALVGGPILLAAATGGVVGTFAGYLGGWVDALVVGIADVFGSVPSFLMIWVLYFGLVRWVPGESSLLLFGLLLALMLWPNYAQAVRPLAQEVGRTSYVEAARAGGAGPTRIVRKHVLPNSFVPVFAQAPFDVYAIFFVLTLFPFINCRSVFGGGYPLVTALPTTLFPEWGSVLGHGACYGWSVLPELNYWWMYAFPLGAIVGFGMGVALFCDGAERMFGRR
jgi:peptide/nickel transport system permease protein